MPVAVDTLPPVEIPDRTDIPEGAEVILNIDEPTPTETAAEKTPAAEETSTDETVDPAVAQAELQQKAELIDTLNRELAANGVNTIAGIAQSAGLNEEQKAELIRQLLPKPEDTVPEFEPSGNLEPELLKRGRMDWLFKGEQQVTKMLGEHRQEIAPYIDAASMEVAVLRAEVAGLKEILGVTSNADRKQIAEEMKKPGTTFDAAVEKVYNRVIKAEVAKAVQSLKDRPNTPSGTDNGHMMERKAGKPMTDYLHALNGGAKL